MTIDYVDQNIQCKDCPATFLFSAGEQKFFADNNFVAPKRCKECRARKKAGGAGAAPPNSGASQVAVTGAGYVEAEASTMGGRRPKRKEERRGGKRDFDNY